MPFINVSNRYIVKFFLRLFFFLFPLLLLAITGEILLRRVPNDYSYKSEYLDRHSEDIRVLILGSSHSYSGINPDYFNCHAFNAAHVSQAFDYDFLIFEKYRSRLSNLKAVIMPISYFTFWEEMETCGEPWRMTYYNLYYHLKKYRSVRYDFEIFGNQRVNLNKFITYYIKRDKTVLSSERGWNTINLSRKPLDLDETAKSAMRNHTIPEIDSKENIRRFQENLHRLEKLLSFCSAQGVKVLFFTPPASEAYRNRLDKKQMDTTFETIRLVESEHSNCDYINLLETPLFTDEDYFDSNHLNPEGARKLSLLLNEKLESICF